MPDSHSTITLNGARRNLAPGDTVTNLVTEATGQPDGQAPSPGIAVAVNARVVPRSLWDTVTLSAGDEVELVSATQGG